MEGSNSFIRIQPKVRIIPDKLKIRNGRIVLPLTQLEHFKEKYVELLFDPKNNLIGIKPSSNPLDFRLRPSGSGKRYCNIFYCSHFLKYYNIPPQDVDVKWDNERKMLIGKVKRCTKPF